MVFLHYLPGKAMNVFVSFQEDRQSVMAIDHGPVGPNPQGARLSGPQ
jgi:hypothetical protein